MIVGWSAIQLVLMNNWGKFNIYLLIKLAHSHATGWSSRMLLWAIMCMGMIYDCIKLTNSLIIEN